MVDANTGLIERISTATIDDLLLTDAAALYAAECIAPEDQDDFIDDFLDDEDNAALLKKAIADVLALAHINDVVTDFRSFVSTVQAYDDRYPLAEEDERVATMKIIMLQKLCIDAAEDDGAQSNGELEQRIKFIRELIEG